MASPAKIARHTNPQEELFLTKYLRLCEWALKLTQNDRERAEDLVHDLYLQLVHARPNLDAITNLDGYLYRTLYNLNISQLRRRTNRQVQSLSVVDFDSAESSLRAADPRELIRYQDDLRQVCHYASIRKDSSKAGSALILRFLHGYFPREIALVMKCTREAVEERLRLARNEARQFLQNPTQLRFLLKPAETTVPAPKTGFVQPVDQLLLELRQQVFDSRQGTCLHAGELKQLYGRTGKLDHATLSHLVSCPVCLEETNQILDLAPLVDRFPTDTIGNDQPSRTGNKRTGGGDGDGGDGGGDDVGGGGGAEEQIHKFRRRAQQVLEQRPQSLRISINGNVAAEQLVTSDSCTQILSLNNLKEIEFIEVLSEQQTQLLMISLTDQPVSGILHSGISLSDDRRLDLSVDLDETRPRVEVVYRDLSAVSPAETASPKLVTASPAHLLATTIHKVFDQLKQSFRFVLNPAAITATVALMLITVLLFVRFSVPPVTAMELLDRTTRVETTILQNTDVATYRTLSLETRRSDRAESIKQRVEIWHSAKLGKTSRRIYDAAGRLNKGEWSQTNGTATIYQTGRSPESRVSAALAEYAIIEAGEYWRLDLSAQSFRALLENSDSIAVEEDATSYLLTFNANKPAIITQATLRIDKQSTRSVKQTLILNQNGVTTEVHFVETGFEQKSLDAVPQSAFEPDKEFENPGTSFRSSEHGESRAVSSAEAVASVELEIEVTYLLNRIKANLGEQITVSRTPGGALRVEAVTETQTRKTEILQALEPVRNNPAVRIDVSTVAEAARKAERTTQTNIDREVEVADNSGPSDGELRTYFMSRVPPDAVDSEIRTFTQAVLNNSRQAVLRASALQKLVQRFTTSDVESLSPDAREKWTTMIREQVTGYQRAVAAVRNDLRRIYPAAGSATAIVSPGSVQEAGARLLRISFRNDDAIRRAFTIAEGNSGSAGFSVELWQSLAEAEQLAREIQRLTSE